jgi:hypothetical protein
LLCLPFYFYRTIIIIRPLAATLNGFGPQWIIRIQSLMWGQGHPILRL